MRLVGRHEGAVDAIAVRGDGVVISAGRDGRVIAWGAGDVFRSEPPNEEPRALAVSGDVVVIGTTAGRVLRVRGGRIDEPWGSFDDGHGGVGALAVAPGRGLLVVGSGLERFELYRLDGGRVWRGATYKWPYAVDVSRDERHVLCATWQPDLHVVDLDPLPPEGDLYGDCDAPGPIFGAVILDDGRVAVVGATEDGGFARIAGHALVVDEGLHAIARSADGRRVAFGGNDQAITVVDVDSLARRTIAQLGAPWSVKLARCDVPSHAPFHVASGPGAILALAFHGDTVVCGTADGRVLELDV